MARASRSKRGRWLEGQTVSLAPHVEPRQPVELVVNERHQEIDRALVAIAPGPEQGGHVIGGGQRDLQPRTPGPV